MAEHTPGPWHILFTSEPDSFGPGRERYIGKSHEDQVCRTVGYDDRAKDIANAELIAAAPDLLAACEKLVAEQEEQCIALGWKSAEQYYAAHAADEAFVLIKSAIAKAKGGA